MTASPKVETAFNASVREAVKNGRIDRKTHGAAIAAARKLARALDEPGWPELPSGKVDNVTPATFLRYCEALGLTPVVKQQAAPSARQAPVLDLRHKVQVMKTG